MGRPVVRPPSVGNQHINYDGYNPPSLWSAPYSVLLGHFAPVEPGEWWLQHSGEELLAPVEGSVQYQFRWAPNGKLSRITLDEPVPVGSILRINPQVPHHTWAAGDRGATAWLIMRDAANSPSAITLNIPPLDEQKPKKPSDFGPVPTSKLNTPHEFAMRAWDLGRAFARQRMAANLSLKEVAVHCGVEKAQLSRFETADARANLPINALVRVARFLRVGILDLIENADWYACSARISREVSTPGFLPIELRPPGLHWLHTQSLTINESDGRLPVDPMLDVPWSSWIVLEGTVLMTWTSKERPRIEVAAQGSVVHFRQGRPSLIEARERASILEVSYSTLCRCGGDMSVRNPVSPNYKPHHHAR